jgi:endo-1,4-beta-D-glucanase Y
LTILGSCSRPRCNQSYGTAIVFGLSLAVAIASAAGCATPPGEGGDDDVVPPHADGGPPTPSCPGATETPGQPFAAHALPYTAGSILPSNHTAAELDEATKTFYDVWKNRYLREGSPCGAGHVFVATGMDDSLTVSEAHGYGMVLLAFMAGHDADAHRLFDGAYAFFRAHPTELSPDLLSWSQDGACKDNQGQDSASDGDLDIAYALLLADKQWGSGGAIDYHAEALKVIAAIRTGDLDASSRWVLLGNWVDRSDSHYKSTRTSDFMPGHFASFGVASGDGEWSGLLDAEYGLVDTMQTAFAADTGLLPDFITDPTGSPAPAPANFLESVNDGRYGYNACRDPWRLGVHYLTSGDARAKAAIERLDAWIESDTGGDARAIHPGYNLDGSMSAGNYFAHAFVSPFGVAAMSDASHQAWLNAIWDATTEEDNTNYYDDSLKLLSMIAMSGNWWAPEAAACPQ